MLLFIMSKCRACLKSMRNMIPFNENYIMYFNILTNLNLQLSCDNPQLLCKRCFNTLQQFIEFREKCIAADAEFTNTSIRVQSQEPGIPKDVKQENGIIIRDFEDNDTDYKWEVDNEISYGNNLKYELEYNTEPRTTEISETKDIKTEEENIIKCNKTSDITRLSCAEISETKDIKTDEENIIKCNKTSDITRLPCGLCSSSFEDKTELHSHLQTHKNCRRCPVCGEKFADWQEAIAHRLTHLQKKYQQCHLCQLVFKTVISMEHHLRTAHHIEGKTKTLRCKECDKIFKTQKRLRAHAQKHGDKRYYCDFCKKLFLNKCSLRKHLASHADECSESGTFKCNVCDFVCKNKGNLTIHQIHKHKVEGREFCSTKKTYVKKDGSVCKVKAVLCPVCGKILTNSSYQRHLHSHDVEGWFRCKLCPARFKWRQTLVTHQDKHTGKPRYACEHCPARFYFPSVLVKHRRVHTGERPYVCDICHKAFTGGSNLKLHMRVHGKYLIKKRNENELAGSVKPFYQLKT